MEHPLLWRLTPAPAMTIVGPGSLAPAIVQ